MVGVKGDAVEKIWCLPILVATTLESPTFTLLPWFSFFLLIALSWIVGADPFHDFTEPSSSDISLSDV